MHSFFFYIKQGASGLNRIPWVVYSGALFEIISVSPHERKKKCSFWIAFQLVFK